MSVTLVPKPTDHEPRHRKTYTQLANEAVFENRSICDECFVRVRAEDSYRRAHRGILGYDVDEADDYGVLESYTPKTTCADCGSVGCNPIDDTLSVRQAIDRVPNLAERLREAGHEPNVKAMYYVVENGKRRNGLQGYDDDLFKLAARMGLKQGRAVR